MNLKAFLRRQVQALLWRKGLRIAQATPPAMLDEFLAAIRPVSTDLGLIRMGSRADGGYLIPNDMDGLAACFSPGVAEVADFELGMAQRGIPCFLADYSVDGPPVQHELFCFEKKYLGISESPTATTLATWVRRNAPTQGDLLLQMDIEGAEYEVISDTPMAVFQRFRIIVAEFHDLNALLCLHSFNCMRRALAKLLSAFHVVHLHPNNNAPVVRAGRYEIPPVLEITFLRKDRAEAVGFAASFPHPLDRTNVPSKSDFPLPECWHAPSPPEAAPE